MRRLALSLGLIAVWILSGCSGVGDSSDGIDPDIGPFEPAPAVMPRLTAIQYRNALVDLFGEDLPPTPVEPDTNPYLFTSIGATTNTLSELGAQQYADAAATVADWVFEDPQRRSLFMSCTPAGPGDSCVERSIRELGYRLFRRPMQADELDRWVAVARDSADGDADRGARHALYGMLQSPNFLYRIELGETDPNDSTRLRYTSYEMAQRVSFLLWNTAPDAELLASAERGDLLTDAGLHDQARRLLDSPRARQAVQSFFAEYFDLGGLDRVERDVAIYPAFTPTLAESMRTEVKLLVDDYVFRRDADIRDLFSTRRTFVNSDLANLYEVDAPGATKIAFVPVDLPESGPRAGILTFGAFLTMNAHPTETSPTRRGKYVRERVLCESIDPPPDGVDFNLDDPTGEAKTLRERLEQHRADPFCASCHKFMDPPGFLFEGFDSVGAFRTTESNGYPLDTSGDLDGIPLADARDLADVLLTDERVPACVVKQLYRHANARLDAPGEERALAELGAAFEDSGFRFQDLLVELVLNDGFRIIAAREVSP